MRAVIQHFRELWRYRVLVQSLVWREVRARYRGSALGFFWTLLNPLFLLLVYRLVFTKYTQAVQVENYSVFVFCGLLPWLWMSTSIANGTVSILNGGALINRVCMPPQVLPAVMVLSNLVNFLFALPIALVAAAVYGIMPGPWLLMLPVAIAVQLLFLYPVVLLLASITVRFRDVQFLVQNLLTVWFFLTPIAYTLEGVPERYRALAMANPATPILRPFQAIIFERRWPEPRAMLLGLAWGLVLLPLSVRIFDAMRDGFAEEI